MTAGSKQPTASRRLRLPAVHAAVLGLTHPHSGKLVQTLINLPEVDAISLWEDAPGAAQAAAIPRSAKVGLVSAHLPEVLGQRGLDFAIVAVRTDRAAEVARQVVCAGKHLLAEKPVGLSAQEIRTVQRAADAAGVKAAVLYLRRSHPAMQHARALVREGRLGALLSVEARLITTQVRFRDPGSWLFRRRHAGGGILTWLGCHFLDLIPYVSGDEISAVSACLARTNGERIDVEDTAAIALQFRSRAVGTFQAGYALAHSGSGYLNPQGFDSHLAWHARRGRVVWPGLHQPLLHVEGAGRPAVRDISFPLPASSSYGGACGEAFVRAFIRSVREGTPLPSTLADALQVARVIEACQRSATEGRRVKVAEAR